MPYTADHKQKTRERIIECARQLFNRKGFSNVTVDEIMASAGLTRGGFYNHFSSKDDLFVEAVEAYGRCNPADRWPGVELDFAQKGDVLAEQIINAYVSREHLHDIEGHCPMIAVPSDVARAGPDVKRAYAASIENMAAIFEAAAHRRSRQSRQRALSLVALCVGGMVLARTLDDPVLAEEIREATLNAALGLKASMR